VDSLQRAVLCLQVGHGAKKLLTVKNKLVMKYHKGPQALTYSLDKLPKLRKMDIRFGMWNVRSLYRSGSLMKAVKELSNIS
jgi:hypothetical protein